MFLQKKKKKSLGALLIWKGYAQNLGLQPYASGVCMSMCALACFYLSAAGHTLMVCVCVCVASVVSIPVRSWLEESKSNRASHSDLRPATEGNTAK